MSPKGVGRLLLDYPRTFHCNDYFVVGGMRSLHLLRSFRRSDVPVDFFGFLSTQFAACSKPPSRGNHRKASYPRTEQRNQSGGGIQIMQSELACLLTKKYSFLDYASFLKSIPSDLQHYVAYSMTTVLRN